MSNDQHCEKVRIDKWLWAARFYKTRGLATEAITGGKVHLNDARVKPARAVQIGDMVSISKGPYKTIIEVLALSDKRGPAKVAALLYQETEESAQQRALVGEQLKSQKHALANYEGKGRPTKRDRRHIIRFVNKNG